MVEKNGESTPRLFGAMTKLPQNRVQLGKAPCSPLSACAVARTHAPGELKWVDWSMDLELPSHLSVVLHPGGNGRAVVGVGVPVLGRRTRETKRKPPSLSILFDGRASS